MAKILIIDDDTDVTDAGKLVLEKAGHTVSIAHNVESGKAAISKEQPDLLILDVMMENYDDGFVLAQYLRKEGYKFPILMLSSIGKVTGNKYDKDDEMVPVDMFVDKPVIPNLLIEKVNELLAS